MPSGAGEARMKTNAAVRWEHGASWSVGEAALHTGDMPAGRHIRGVIIHDH